MNLFFDEKGNLQNNFELNGSVRDGKLKFLKKNEFKGINFLFSIKKDLISFVKIRTSFDKMNLSSQKIQIKKEQNGFLVKGKISNQKIKLNSDYIEKYLFQRPWNKLEIKLKLKKLSEYYVEGPINLESSEDETTSKKKKKTQEAFSNFTQNEVKQFLLTTEKKRVKVDYDETYCKIASVKISS